MVTQLVNDLSCLRESVWGKGLPQRHCPQLPTLKGVGASLTDAFCDPTKSTWHPPF
jgi:hypothetical protein